MSDYILMSGDTAMFLPNFGVATVLVRPGTLKGSGKTTLEGNKICLEGDEKQVSVPGCLYLAPSYTIPGTGTIKIKSLAADQKTKTFSAQGKPALLKGNQFTAEFSVVTPASNPSGFPSDTTLEYTGLGQFITMNKKWQSR